MNPTSRTICNTLRLCGSYLGIVYCTAMAHIILITITISMPRPNDYPKIYNDDIPTDIE